MFREKTVQLDNIMSLSWLDLDPRHIQTCWCGYRSNLDWVPTDGIVCCLGQFSSSKLRHNQSRLFTIQYVTDYIITARKRNRIKIIIIKSNFF